MAAVRDKMDAIESEMSVGLKIYDKSIAESVEIKRSEHKQNKTTVDKSQLDKFKRRLVRAVYRMKQQKKPEMEMWAELKKEIGYDCKVLWQHMRTLTLKKLRRLLPANDMLKNITKVAWLTATDWLLFDLILVHENVDVISVNGEDTEQGDFMEPECLNELFELVRHHEVEDMSGHDLTQAWARITFLYNKGRQVSPMLLQLRWYQMKKRARTRFYNFWSTYHACQHFLREAMARKPTDLQIAIITKYNSIITTTYPSWDALIEERRVILSEEFVNALKGGILLSAEKMGNEKQEIFHQVQTTSGINLSQTLTEFNRKVDADVSVKPALDISGNKDFINSSNAKTLWEPLNISTEQTTVADAIIAQKLNTENETVPRDVEYGMAEITRNKVETLDVNDIEITKIKSESEWNSNMNIIEDNKKKDCRDVIDREAESDCTRETIHINSSDNIHKIPINIYPLMSIEDLKQGAVPELSINNNEIKTDRIVDRSTDMAEIVRLNNNRLSNEIFHITQKTYEFGPGDEIDISKNTTMPLDKTLTDFLDCIVTVVDSRDKIEKLTYNIDNKKLKHELYESDNTIINSDHIKNYNTEPVELSESDEVANIEKIEDIKITKIKSECCFEDEINNSVDDATVNSSHFISSMDLYENVNDKNTLTQHLLHNDSELRKNKTNEKLISQEIISAHTIRNIDTEIHKIDLPFSDQPKVFHEERNNTDIMDDKLTKVNLKRAHQTEIFEKKLKYYGDVLSLESKIVVSDKLNEKVQKTINQQISPKIPKKNTDVQETVIASATNSYGNIMNGDENITNKKNINLVYIKSKNNLSEESTDEENFFDSFDEENFIKIRIDFEDDGIKFEEESENTKKENILLGEPTNQVKSDKNKTANDNDPKTDLKLLMNMRELKVPDVFKTTDYHYLSPKDKAIKESRESPSLCYELNGSQSDDIIRNDSDIRVKCSSWLLQKPKNCNYNPIQVCKNPDFNIRLKQKICGFLSYMKNRDLLKICKPLTIDLHKAFEKRLLNGTMYLKGDFKIEKEIVNNNSHAANKTLTVYSFKTKDEEIKPFVKSALLTSGQEQKEPLKVDVPDTNIIRNVVDSIKSEPIINIPNHILSNHESTFNSDVEKMRMIQKGLNIKIASGNELKPRKIMKRRSCVALSWAAKYPKNYEYLITLDTLKKMLNLFHGNVYELHQTYYSQKKCLGDTIDIPHADMKLNNCISEQNTDPITISKGDNSETNRKLCNMDITEIKQFRTLKATQGNKSGHLNKKPYKLDKRYSGVYCCYARKRIANINKPPRGRLHDCVKLNFCYCCCRAELIFMNSEKESSSSKSKEIYPVIDFKNDEVIKKNKLLNEEVEKKSGIMHDSSTKTQENSFSMPVNKRPNITVGPPVAEPKKNKTSENGLVFGQLKKVYKNTSISFSEPIQNENQTVDEAISNCQNINSRKTIISDLMKMSGIFPEDITMSPDSNNISTPNVTLPSNIIPVANAVSSTNYVTSIPYHGINVISPNITLPHVNLVSIENEEHLDSITKVRPKLTAERSSTGLEFICITPIKLYTKNRLLAHLKNRTNRPYAPDVMINNISPNMHGLQDKLNNIVKPLKLFKTTYPRIFKGKDRDIIEKQKTIYPKKPIYLKKKRLIKISNFLKFDDDKKKNVDISYDSSDEEPLAKKSRKIAETKNYDNTHKVSDSNSTVEITGDNPDVSVFINGTKTSLEVIRSDVEGNITTIHPVTLKDESGENDVCVLGM